MHHGDIVNPKSPITANRSVVYYGQERITEHTIHVEEIGAGNVGGSDIYVWAIIFER